MAKQVSGNVNNWQRLGHLPFFNVCESRKFLETKIYPFISIDKNNIYKKKNSKIFFLSRVCISIGAKLTSILFLLVLV